MVNSFFVSNGTGAANRILRRGERLLPKRYTDRHKKWVDRQETATKRSPFVSDECCRVECSLLGSKADVEWELPQVGCGFGACGGIL